MTINQQDFITPITGNVVIQNNGARLVLQANADLNTLFEGDESFKLVLRKGSNTGPVVATTAVIIVRDTSNVRTYSIVTSPAGPGYLENSNILITINTTNYPNNSTLYFDTIGNVTSQFFKEGNTGSFVLVNNTANVTLRGNINLGTDIEKDFKLRIKDEPSGEVLFTGNTFSIIDTALARLTATGGTIIDSGGFRTHIFTSSTDFSVSRVGVEPVTITYNIVAGGGGGGSQTAPIPSGAGGGAGGFLVGTYVMPTTGAGPYAVVVGGGGGGVPHISGASLAAGQGSNSLIFGALSVGGGGALSGPMPNLAPGALWPKMNGGSGAGGVGNRPVGIAIPGGTGTPDQGFSGISPGVPGGDRTWTISGGAGAAGSGGVWTSQATPPARTGGSGQSSPISVPPSYGHHHGDTGQPSAVRYFAGGGGVGGAPGGIDGRPIGGGGWPAGDFQAGNPGQINTGSGGSGLTTSNNPPNSAGSGGSGIVIIRYPYTP